MPWIPLAAAALSTAGGVYAANKAAKATNQAAQASQVDIDALDAKTRAIALKNAQESAALEQAMTPQVPALRSSSLEGVMAGLNPDSNYQRSQDTLLQLLGKPVGTAVAGKSVNDTVSSPYSPLLAAAIDKARANLALGGSLDRETQNAVTRSSLATAGSVTPGNLGLGRDVVARDLGLTSLGLQSQRLQDAAALGQSDFAMRQAGADNSFRNIANKFQNVENGYRAAGMNNDLAFNNSANLLNQIQLLRSLSDTGFSRNLAAAQFGQSIPQPVVGLDPGSIADVVSGNATNRSAALSNQANIYGAQGQGLMGLAGTMGSIGLLPYLNGATQPKKT